MIPSEEHYKRRSRSEEATFSTFHQARSPTDNISKMDFSKPPPPIRPVNPTPRTSNYPLPPGTEEFFKTPLEVTSSKIQAQLKDLDSTKNPLNQTAKRVQRQIDNLALDLANNYNPPPPMHAGKSQMDPELENILIGVEELRKQSNINPELNSREEVFVLKHRMEDYRRRINEYQRKLNEERAA